MTFDMSLTRPSSRMVQPYWLVDREHRREAVVVDGNAAWALFCASADGDHGAVKRLIDANHDLIYAQIWYQQPIDLAIREGHLPIVKTILKADRERRLGTRIYEGAHYRVNIDEIKRRGYGELAQWLEEHKQGLTPNYKAEFEVLKKRIASGDTLVIDDFQSAPNLLIATDRQGQTGLHLAIRHQDFMLLTALVEMGAAIESKTIENRSAVDYAVQFFPPAIPYLLKHGAEPTIGALIVRDMREDLREMLVRDPDRANHLDSFGNRPLALAARHRRREIVKLLLENGADPNLPGPNNADGDALYIATENWDHEIMKLLLEAGANPNAEIDSSGCCLSVLVDHRKWGNHPARRAYELLTKYGAFDPPWAMTEEQQLEFLKTQSTEKILTSYDGGWADFHNQLCSVEALDRYVERVGNDLIKSYPWDAAVFDIRNKEYARQLVHYGLDVNRRDWLGRTHLHTIAASGNLERAELLVELGAEINPIDVEWSTTPLGYAARKGRVKMAKWLLDNGARKALPVGPEWAQPKAYAERAGSDEITALLRPED